MAVSAAIVAFIVVWVATLCTWDYTLDETFKKVQSNPAEAEGIP
jgi:hypothetical protein